MSELIGRLKAFPLVTVEMMLATLFVNVLALASPLFVIQVLNRYVAYGVDSTLATLTLGVMIAVLFEFLFRGVRHRLAEAVAKSFDRRLSENTYNLLLNVKISAMDRITPGMRREIVGGVAAIQNAAGATNMTAVLDVPFALLFVGALFLLSWQIAAVVLAFIVLVAMYSAISLHGMRRPIRKLQTSTSRRNVLLAVAVNTAETVRAFNAKGFLRDRWAQGTDTHETSLA